MADLSTRALAILRSVDRIYCEDTRHSGRLLERFAIHTGLRAYHAHNERRTADGIVEQIRKTPLACALISDAGTPLISDPGFVLVRAAAAAGIPVVSVPGPSAVTAALSISGMPTDRFVFEGFLPAQRAARELRLKELASERRTLVCYEAPHRIVQSLEGMLAVFGEEREIALARELTKRYETVYRGTIAEVLARLRSDSNARRGEFVILISGSEISEDLVNLERVLDIVLSETDKKTAVRLATALTGIGRNEVYRRVLARGAAALDVENKPKN
jgi:16S rRNA (cytidine1402-2'-O)-methyltransferase